MAKTSGLGAQVKVDDGAGTAQTISNDVNDFTFSTPKAAEDTTGVDKSAHERLLLLADFSVSLKGTFNPTANMSHDVFKTVPSTAVLRTTSIAPTSNNATPILACETLYENYEIARAASGALTWTATGNLADGTVPLWA